MTLFQYLTAFIEFFSQVIIPFIVGVAFLVFVWNVIRYFVIEGHSEDGQKAAKAQIAYSLAAFVVIFIFWGMVTLLAESLNLQNENPVCPDYLMQLGQCSRYNNPLRPPV